MIQLRALTASFQARLAAREPGQGMVEYGLILAAIAIAVIIAMFAIGPKIASMFVTAGASMSSDRKKKANLAPVDPRRVLARLGELPIESWT